MEEIILASTSPRRKQIFMQMQLPFKIIAPVCDEESVREPDPVKKVMKLAYMKGLSVLNQGKNENSSWIAGFDTIVLVQDTILGKANSEMAARGMLLMLSGRVHKVYTGIALNPGAGEWDIRVAESEVKFRQMSREEIDFYLSTGEWKGVAGSYRIQQQGALFIERIKGSYSNIVGLPISHFYGMLRDNNYSFSLRQDS